MAFTDEIKIKLSAGKGGDGVVRWRHEKYKEKAGPSGGNGGRGGNVVVKAVRDIFRLSHYAQFSELSAENGEDGMKDSRAGAKGEDLLLHFPLGSVIKNQETEEEWELLNEEDEVIILKGGKGGLGNEHFKSSKNVTPQEQTDGKKGETAVFLVELRLIANIGLVGLPNAGKSTLLNFLTGANSKVGNYRFTTLEPHLGSLHGIIVADIPGLIEGASEGRGLGHSFLRHISRTELIAFCVSAEGKSVVDDFKAVKKELDLYDSRILLKPKILIITKEDIVDEETLKKKIQVLKKEIEIDIVTVSVLDDRSVSDLAKYLVNVVKKNKNKKLS
jgi:GTP-binding protein